MGHGKDHHFRRGKATLRKALAMSEGNAFSKEKEEYCIMRSYI